MIKQGIQVPIIFATQTNTIKGLASTLQRTLQQANVKATILDAATIQPADINAPFFIYMTCTFFMGEHPKSVVPFITKVRANDAEWAAAIKDKQYAVFGIGSTKYKLFCRASEEIDTKFTEFGGKRIMAAAKVDRNLPEGHDPQFQTWVDALVKNMGVEVKEDQTCLYEVRQQSMIPINSAPKGYFWARIVERKQLSDNVVDGVQHYYRFLLPAPITYKAGQHIAIMPRNHISTMQSVFASKVIYLDAECKTLLQPEHIIKAVALAAEQNLPLINDYINAWHLIAQYLDLHAVVTQNLLLVLSKYASDQKQKDELKQLSQQSSQEAFKQKFVTVSTKIADLFQLYPSLKIPVHKFLEIMPPMKHRLYSIASSPKLIGAQNLELIITDVEWDSFNFAKNEKTRQRGLSTGFMFEVSNILGNYCNQYVDRMGMFPAQIHESPLEPPKDSKLPIITLALGSGYAPFRSILQERMALAKQGVELGPFALFLGIRRRADYGPMLEELNTWCSNNIAHCYLAISRETETPAEGYEKIPMTKDKRAPTVKITYGGHITKAIVDNYEVFGEHMTAPNNLILYCGKAGKIPEELAENIQKALVKFGINEAESKKMWVQYLENGRTFFEAW